MKKHMFRQKVIAALTEIDKQTRVKKLEKIYEQLFDSHVWKYAQCIGVTVSQFPELETDPIIQQAIKENKIVAVPKSNPRLKTMDFKQIKTRNELEIGYANILEPKEELRSIHRDNIDLLIVPGVVYRRDGYRIGFGGGFYDRFLVDYKGNTVSIAFTEQICDQFSINEFDLPVQLIINENEMIDTSC